MWMTLFRLFVCCLVLAFFCRFLAVVYPCFFNNESRSTVKDIVDELTEQIKAFDSWSECACTSKDNRNISELDVPDFCVLGRVSRSSSRCQAAGSTTRDTNGKQGQHESETYFQKATQVNQKQTHAKTTRQNKANQSKQSNKKRTTKNKGANTWPHT